MKRGLLPAAALALLALFACSPPFPRQLLDQTDRGVAFADVAKNAESMKGKLVMLGGTIVETRNLKEGTQIEVLQKPLDGQGRPYLTDETQGRFLVVTPQFLDNAVYHRGRNITVIAEISGRRTQKLGEIDYPYPLLLAKAIHLWDPYAGSRFSVGVGVGVFHGY